MGHSYKNTSMGGSHPKRLPIGENKAHVPPAGASTSYEKALKSMDAKDNAAMSRGHYSREKLNNK